MYAARLSVILSLMFYGVADVLGKRCFGEVCVVRQKHVKVLRSVKLRLHRFKCNSEI